MTTQDSPKAWGAAPACVDGSRAASLILPPQWSGIPLELCAIPHCEEKGLARLTYPKVYLALSGNGRRWYKYGAQVLELATTTGGIELQAGDYERDWARWDGAPGRSIGLHLTPQVIGRLVKGMPEFNIETTHEFFDPKIQWLMQELLEEAQRGAPGGALYSESLSCALIAYLAKTYGKQKRSDQAPGGLSPVNRQRVIDFIEAHLGDQVSITDLANEVSLSPHHFARSFAISFGQAPHRYLQQRRIEVAQRMLALSTFSISDIAMELGFSDQSHFTRVFRQQVGMTPSQARSA